MANAFDQFDDNKPGNAFDQFDDGNVFNQFDVDQEPADPYAGQPEMRAQESSFYDKARDFFGVTEGRAENRKAQASNELVAKRQGISTDELSESVGGNRGLYGNTDVTPIDVVQDISAAASHMGWKAGAVHAMAGNDPKAIAENKELLAEQRKKDEEFAGYAGSGATYPFGIGAKDISEGLQSLPFSMYSELAYLVGYGPTLFASKSPAISHGAGSSLSGAMAYRMDSASLLSQMYDPFAREFKKQTGNDPTPDDFAIYAAQDDVQSAVRTHALAEAGFEALGNFITTKSFGDALKGTVSKLFGTATGKSAAKEGGELSMTKAIAQSLGGELATETPTQMVQSRQESIIGLNDGPMREYTSVADWGESFGEVFLPVVMLSGAMGAGAGAIKKGSEAYSSKKMASNIKNFVGKGHHKQIENQGLDNAIVNAKEALVKNPGDKGLQQAVVDLSAEKEWRGASARGFELVGETDEMVRKAKEQQAMERPAQPKSAIPTEDGDVTTSLGATPYGQIMENEMPDIGDTGFIQPKDRGYVEFSLDETLSTEPGAAARTAIPEPGIDFNAANGLDLTIETPMQAQQRAEATRRDQDRTGRIFDQQQELKDVKQPEGLDDARLKRLPYRHALQYMTNDLLVNGGSVIVPVPGTGYMNSEGVEVGLDEIRTPSLNPDWFKSLVAEEGVSKKIVEKARNKALAGEKLGVREARIVKSMLDQITGEREQDADYFKEARAYRKANQLSEDPMAGELWTEEQYGEDWDAVTRTRSEILADAVGVNPDVADSVLERMFEKDAADSQIVKAMQAVINGATYERAIEAGLTAQGRPTELDAGIGQTQGEQAGRSEAYPQKQAIPTEAAVEPQAATKKRAIPEAAEEEKAAPAPQEPAGRTEPSDAQKAAGNYPMIHKTINGLNISIENEAGTTRTGTDKDGETWSNKMTYDYGYIKGTEGIDGDHVDIFLGKDANNAELPVFIVNQKKESGRMDEHKVMLGFATEAEAKKAYLSNYAKGWDGIKDIVEMPLDQFKDWLKNGDTTKKAVAPKAEALKAKAKEKREAATTKAIPDMQDKYDAAIAKKDLLGSVKISKAVTDEQVKQAEAKISAGEMVVFKAGDMTYAIHPSAQQEGKYQLTTYNDTGALGDTQYDSIAKAVDDANLLKANLLSKGDAKSVMDKLSAAEAKYQESKSKKKAEQDLAAAKQELVPVSEMTPAEIKAEIESISAKAEAESKAYEDERGATPPELLTSATDFMDDAAKTRMHDLKQALPSQGEEAKSAGDRIKAKVAARKAKAAAPEITDVGEKLGGARKDMTFASKDLTDDDIRSQPLSKIWPQKEIDSIEDELLASFATAFRQEIPQKPQKGYKLDRWVSQIKQFKELMARISDDHYDGTLTGSKILDMMRDFNGGALSDVAAKIELFNEIDRANWKRIGRVIERPDAYYFEDGKKVPSPMVSVTIDKRSHTFRDTKSVTGALAEINKVLGVEATTKDMKFEIRGRSGKYFINKTGDREYRRLIEFNDLAKAREYLTKNNADLVAMWDAVKERDNVTKADVRNKENRPRTGKDYRNGKDVDAESFKDTFGFRGVEFGNWVKQGKNAKERQGMINLAYDALMDLAEIVGIPPKAISLNGSLGLGFGSRGSGSASAHFESGLLVINLTKTRGAGTFAHEWFHAVDNYFQREKGMDMSNKRETRFVTYAPETTYAYGGARLTLRELERRRAQHPTAAYFNPDNWKKVEGSDRIRPEVAEAFADLVDTLNESPMKDRASNIDGGKADGYWSRIIERAARSFENYVILKMSQNGYDNDYLANVKEWEKWGDKNPGRYPYLKPEEMEPVERAFDSLFGTIKTKETDLGDGKTGVAMYSRGGVEVAEYGSTFKTGKPVTFAYIHNKDSATKLFGVPDKDSPYGRGYEPSGRYVSHVSKAHTPDWGDFDTGTITLNNPLVINNNSSEWKKELSDRYSGKTGKELSKALISDGYDGVVTVDYSSNGKPHTSEILDLTTFDESKAKYSRTSDMGFYSQLERVIEVKLPNTGTAESFKTSIASMVKSGKIKAEEHEWSGVDEWLDDQTGKISKKDVLDYLQANNIQVEEVTKGDPSEDDIDAFLDDEAGEGFTREEALEYLRNDEEAVKFAKYQLHGGENYKELLLTLPTDRHKAKVIEDAGRWFILNPGGGRSVAFGSEKSAKKALSESIKREAQGIPNNFDHTSFISGHYDERNILAHIRFNERTDADGKRVLFIEEVQSDWHQAGRKKGYATTETLYEVVNPKGSVDKIVASEADAEAAIENRRFPDMDKAEDWSIRPIKNIIGVPNAPFKTTWPLLAMKRMIRYAAENGFDRIAWTTGEQQADRYSLSEQVDVIKIEEMPFAQDKKTYSLVAYRDNAIVIDQELKNLNDLDDMIGKEAGRIAREQIEQNGSSLLEGDSLKVGGEGMKGFYDKILPATVNKYVKKWGAKVGETDIKLTDMPWSEYEKYQKDSPYRQKNAPSVHSVDITEKMRDAAMSGQPLFKKSPAIKSGLTVDQVKTFLGKSLNKLGNLVDVEVVQSVSDMPGTHPADVRGMFYGGKVYLVADNLTEKSAKSTFAHEVVGHLGLEGLLGPDGFKALMRQISNMKRLKNRAVLSVLADIRKNYVDENGNYVLDDTQEAREILAHLAEKNPNFGMVRRVMAEIRLWLAKHGLGNFDDAMIESLLVRAARQTQQSYTGVTESAYSRDGDGTFDDIDSMANNGIEVKELSNEEQQQYKDQFAKAREANYASYKTIEGKPVKSGWEKATHALSGGKPAIIYRAGRGPVTPAKFLELGARSNLNQAHLGLYLSSAPEGKYGQYVHEVHLDIRKPKIYKLSDIEALAASGKFNTVEDVKLLALDLMADGHDGIILERAGDNGEDHFIVFHPYQVIEIPSPAYSREHEPVGLNLGMPEETYSDKFVRLFQDSFNRIKALQNQIEEGGGAVDVDSDIYLAEERSSGKITARLTDLDREYMRPIIKKMADYGVTLEELDAYMIARHAQERNEYIAWINPEMQDGGSGMTTSEAQRYLFNIDSETRTKLNTLANSVYAVNNKTLDDLVAGGHLEQETVDEWRERYKFYVPLKGKDGEDGHIGMGQGFSVKGSGIRAALGRGAGNMAESPTAHTFAQAEGAIVRTEKSEVGRALVRLVRANPDPNFWTISQRTYKQFVDLYGTPFDGLDSAPEGMIEGLDYHRVKAISAAERKAAKAEGRKPVAKVAYKIDPNYKKRDDVLSVMEKGQELLINIKDKIVAEQLKKMNSTQLNAVVAGAGTVNRYLAMINTALNPEFVITNLERDFQTAMVNLGGEQSGKMALEVMKNMPMAARGIWQSVFDKGQSEWRKEFDEMQHEGGTIGFFGLEDIETKIKKIHSKLENSQTVLGKSRRAIANIRDVVLDANLSVENAARLAAYKVAKEQWISDGMAPAEAKAKAASLAKNLTVNFNRKGELAPVLNSAYLFYNASIQGTARIVTALGNPRVRKIVGGVAMAAFALAMYNRAAGGDDDDGIPRWDKISDFMKQTNLIIMHPDGSGNFTRIKLPYGYNVFFYAGTATHDLMYDKRKTAIATAMSLASAAMNAFNPIQGADILDTLTPTVLKPFEQDVRNINFMGSNIKPEFPFDNYDRPESQKAFKSTNPALKEIMSAINEATGGDQTHAGLIDLSPETVKHYIGWLTGGAGMTVTRALGTITNLATGEKVEQRNVPFARTLGGKVGSQFDTDRFYKAIEEVNAVDKQLELYKGTPKMLPYKHKNRGVLRLKKRSLQFKNKIKRIRDARDRAYAAGDRELAEKYSEMIRQDMMRFSKMYDDAIEKHQK